MLSHIIGLTPTDSIQLAILQDSGRLSSWVLQAWDMEDAIITNPIKWSHVPVSTMMQNARQVARSWTRPVRGKSCNM